MSPKTAKAYDKARADEAKKRGGTVRRSALPGIVVPSHTTIWVARFDTASQQVRAINLRAPETTKVLKAHELAAWLLGSAEAATETDTTIVFGQRSDLRELIAANRTVAQGKRDTLAAAAASETARMLDVALAKPAGAYVAILTDALRSAYYLQSGANRRELSAWADGFGVAGQPLRQVMEVLTRAAITPGVDGAGAAIAKSIAGGTYHALNAARFGASGLAAVKAFRSLARVQSTWDGALATDELLIDRNLLSGTVSKVDLLEQSQLTVRGVASQPFTFNEGRRVGIHSIQAPGTKLGEALLKEVTTGVADGEEYIIVSLALTARELQKLGKPSQFYIVPATYNSFPSKTQAGVWLGDAAGLPEIPQRDVPLDVILAGAPST